MERASFAEAGCLLLRPIGAQGVLALRWKLTTQQLHSLATAERAIGKTIHVGRAQGLKTAHELLTVPTWGMPAIPIGKANVTEEILKSGVDK